MTVRKFSVTWHRRHRDHHLAAFPDVDQATRDNLRMFIGMAQPECDECRNDGCVFCGVES